MCISGYVSNKLLTYPFRLFSLNIKCIILIIDMYEIWNKLYCIVSYRIVSYRIVSYVDVRHCKPTKVTCARYHPQGRLRPIEW